MRFSPNNYFLPKQYCSITMEIKDDDQHSDNEFEELVFDEGEASDATNGKYEEVKYDNMEPNPTLSTIRIANELKNVVTVQIESADNYKDMNILENQYYFVRVLHSGKAIVEKIQRRYSDFDFLFELLFKKYPGFILPAFPEKGIMSYLKTKVTYSKDESFMNNRIKMIERFLTIILNEETFNIQRCKEIKKFFSEKEYDVFKKTEQQLNNSSVINNTLDKVWSYFKMNRGTKYDPIVDEIKNQKKPFENLHLKVKEIVGLIQEEINANERLTKQQIDQKIVPGFNEFKKVIERYNQQMKGLLVNAQELDFDLFCENEDYMMMLRKIELFEELKNSQTESKNLFKIQKQFNERRAHLGRIKLDKLGRFHKKVHELVANMSDSQKQSL